MIAWIDQLLGGSGEGGQFSLAAVADHVELTEASLILGLKLDWRNRTNHSIPIKEVLVLVHLHGWKQEPLCFYPLERFARIPTQKALQKNPVRPLTLPPKEIHTEHWRFICQEILDLPPGNYTVDVQSKDLSDHVHTSRTKIHLDAKIKYRRNQAWHNDD